MNLAFKGFLAGGAISFIWFAAGGLLAAIFTALIASLVWEGLNNETD